MRMIFRSIFIDKLQQKEKSANVKRESNYRGTKYNERKLKKGAVSRNSAKLGNYKMLVKLRGT